MARYEQMLRDEGPSRRLAMALEMYDFSKALVRAGIVATEPGLPEAEVQKRLFLRFHEHDIPPGLLQRALRAIEARFATTRGLSA